MSSRATNLVAVFTVFYTSSALVLGSAVLYVSRLKQMEFCPPAFRYYQSFSWVICIFFLSPSFLICSFFIIILFLLFSSDLIFVLFCLFLLSAAFFVFVFRINANGIPLPWLFLTLALSLGDVILNAPPINMLQRRDLGLTTFRAILHPYAIDVRKFCK